MSASPKFVLEAHLVVLGEAQGAELHAPDDQTWLYDEMEGVRFVALDANDPIEGKLVAAR